MPPTPESEYQPKVQVNTCPYCNVSFGLLTWKYHCGWCGSVVCDNCSPKTFTLPPVHPESTRVCNTCVPEASTYSTEHKKPSQKPNVSGPECCATLLPPDEDFIVDKEGNKYPVEYDRDADLARIDTGPRKGVRR